MDMVIEFYHTCAVLAANSIDLCTKQMCYSNEYVIDAKVNKERCLMTDLRSFAHVKGK